MRLALMTTAAAMAVLLSPNLCFATDGQESPEGGGSPPAPPAPPAPPEVAKPETAAAAAKPGSRRAKPKQAAKEAGKVHVVMRTSRLSDTKGAQVARDRVARCSEKHAERLIAADQARLALDYDVEDAQQPIVDLAEA